MSDKIQPNESTSTKEGKKEKIDGDDEQLCSAPHPTSLRRRNYDGAPKVNIRNKGKKDNKGGNEMRMSRNAGNARMQMLNQR
jgi:hypothetical protein